MLDRPTHSTPADFLILKSAVSNQNSDLHHGLHYKCYILGLPSETLTGITSYLDPPALLSLSTVHRLLYHHVKDDNTWHRAFAHQFLGIGPESDIHDDSRSFMLRRTENLWRNEYIVRYNLKRRWERSRNTTITHVPQHSSISTMHMMPSHSLLTSSIQYGVVSRSLPLTGRVLRGYLDASGTGGGLGIGNPNDEFTPNVSVCALASGGGTAKICWGFLNGEVAIMTANRAMDPGSRAGARLIRCNVNDQHTDAVLDAVWDGGKGLATATGAADGRVKLWDAQKVICVWSSEPKTIALAPDACVKVSEALTQGYLVGAFKSGDIILWAGFDMEVLDMADVGSIGAIYIPFPQDLGDDDSKPSTHDVASLHIDPSSAATTPTVLVAYKDDPHFYHLRIDTKTKTVQYTTFGDASFGPICSISPFFATDASESSFVVTGDHLGCVSVYHWDRPSPPTGSSVLPIRKFEAHEDGAGVTALAWNGVTLITGSAHGATHVWDALTFEHLRSFASPLPRTTGSRWHHGGAQLGTRDESVRQILVGPEREVLMVSVEDRVMAWRAGAVPKSGGGGAKGKNKAGIVGKKKKDGTAKYYQQLEMQQAILESKKLLKEESEHVQRVYGRERGQRAKLDKLGLDETEAVEYLMMLSRDEAAERGVADQQIAAFIEEGVFEGDFDDLLHHSTHASTSTDRSDFPSVSSPSASPSHRFRIGKPIPRTSLPASTPGVKESSQKKLQENPEHTGIKPDDEPSSPSPGGVSPRDDPRFPAISTSAGTNTNTSPTPVRSTTRATTSGVAGSSSSSSGGGSAPLSTSSRSTDSTRAPAWGTPLARSPPHSRGSSVRSTSPWSRARSGGESGGDEEMDADLKFALELSLAEAMSRGEGV